MTRHPFPLPEVEIDDGEYLPTADLDDPIWSEKPVPNSREYLCIPQISRQATPAPQAGQVEMPQKPEQMNINILENLPDLINVPKELLLDFDSWAQSVLDYKW